MVEQEVIVCNIQRFCLHDGPGIRTTVFLKGCSLHCPWCSNPECIYSMPEEHVQEDGSIVAYGEYMPLSRICSEIMKDEAFYEEGGGITFSGGEPLLWMDKMESLLEEIKAKKIHLCIETSLFADKGLLQIALKYFDFFIVDVKIVEEIQCRQIVGGDLQNYLENIRILKDSRKKFMLRIPLIVPYVSNKNNIIAIRNLLEREKLNPVKIELLQGHNLAEKKYHLLGKEMFFCEELRKERLQEIKSYFGELGGLVEVCRI